MPNLRTVPGLVVLLCVSLPCWAQSPSPPPDPPSAQELAAHGDLSLLNAPPASTVGAHLGESATQRKARHDYEDERAAATIGVATLGAFVGAIGGGVLGIVVGVSTGIAAFPVFGVLFVAGLAIAGAVVLAPLVALLAAAIFNVFYPPMKPPALLEPEEQPSPLEDPGTLATKPKFEKPRELPRNTLNFSPLPPFLSRIFSFEYERVLGDKVSLFASPLLQLSSSSWSITGGGGNAGIRYFFAGDAPHGFFLQPQVHFSIGSLDTALGAGGAIGYTFLIERTLYMSFAAGLAGQFAGTTPIIPILRGNFGFAF